MKKKEDRDNTVNDRHLVCTSCNSIKIIQDPNSGESFCSSCGMVINATTLDLGPEWRGFTPEERTRKRRTGGPISDVYYDKGLSTTFDPKDMRGGTTEQRQKMWRLKKWDALTKLNNSSYRNLSDALSELNILAETLHLPKHIIEEAANIYRKALEKDLIRGRTITGFVAASLYAACRKFEIPRSLKKISEVSPESIKTISRTYRFLLQELDIQMPIDHPMKYVPRIASKIGISRDTERLTIRILRKARKEKVLIGKDPRGMAAAALYMACKLMGDKATQKLVAESAETSEVTLRNRLRDLEMLFGDKEHPKKYDTTLFTELLSETPLPNW
jgi:transcription initiation factor TFIIB